MQLGFNLWAWTWCNISRPRKSGTLGGGTGGTCGTRCPGTFAFLEPKECLEPVEPVKRMGFHRFQAFLGFKHAGTKHWSQALVPSIKRPSAHLIRDKVTQMVNEFLQRKLTASAADSRVSGRPPFCLISAKIPFSGRDSSSENDGLKERFLKNTNSERGTYGLKILIGTNTWSGIRATVPAHLLGEAWWWRWHRLRV